MPILRPLQTAEDKETIKDLKQSTSQAIAKLQQEVQEGMQQVQKWKARHRKAEAEKKMLAAHLQVRGVRMTASGGA